MGYFRHGSTIIVCGPPELDVCESVTAGRTIRMGEPLLRYRQIVDPPRPGSRSAHAATLALGHRRGVNGVQTQCDGAYRAE